MSVPMAANAAGIAAYAGVESNIAATMITGATVDTAAIASILVPVFGALGTEHLIATLSAMGVNLFETGQLSAVHASQAVSALSTSASYTATDVGNLITFPALMV